MKEEENMMKQVMESLKMVQKLGQKDAMKELQPSRTYVEFLGHFGSLEEDEETKREAEINRIINGEDEEGEIKWTIHKVPVFIPTDCIAGVSGTDKKGETHIDTTRGTYTIYENIYDVMKKIADAS